MGELNRIFDIEAIAKKLSTNQDWARRHETRVGVNEIVKGVVRAHYGDRRFEAMGAAEVETLIEDIRHHVIHNTQH